MQHPPQDWIVSVDKLENVENVKKHLIELGVNIKAYFKESKLISISYSGDKNDLMIDHVTDIHPNSKLVSLIKELTGRVD